MGDDEVLMEYEIEERDKYIEEVNQCIREISEFFDVKIPLLALPDYSNLEFQGGVPRLDIQYFQKRIRKLNIPNVVAEGVLTDIDKISPTSGQLKGGALTIAFELVLRRFGFHNQSDPNYFTDRFSELTFDSIGFSPYDVVYALAKLYESRFMRYRLWNDKALEALERYFFIGDPVHCPDEPYFAEYSVSESLSFDEFVNFFDDAVRSEYFDEKNGRVVSHSYTGKDGKTTYFAEYVPIVCIGQEKMQYYYDWRNRIVESIEGE
jgi:hypothetical protein